MAFGFLGLGSIASAVVSGLAREDREILVSERSRDRSAALSNQFSNVSVAPNQEILDRCDTLFLGTTAEQAQAALSPLTFRDGQCVVSFMVGMDTDTLRSLIAPAELVAIMIPFPSIAEGGSPILICPDTTLIHELFGHTNTVIALKDEVALGDYLTAQAILSPALKLTATARDWLSARTGDQHSAEQFLRLLVGGAMLGKPMSDCDVLDTMLDALNTPGGLNQTLRLHMENAGTFQTAEKGLDDLAARFSGPTKD